MEKEKIKKYFIEVHNADPDTIEEYLDSVNWDIDKTKSLLKSKKKKNKEKKIFNVGDIVICIDNKPGKLPQDCVDFLITYKKFKVLDVNDKFNIDIGHKSAESNNPYYFSPNRFELLNGKAPVKVIDSHENDEENNTKDISKKIITQSGNVFKYGKNDYGFYYDYPWLPDKP